MVGGREGKRVSLVWDTGRWRGWWDAPGVQKAAKELDLESRGMEEKTQVEDTHLGVLMHIDDSWSIWYLNTVPEISSQQLCYYWVTDELQEGGG